MALTVPLTFQSIMKNGIMPAVQQYLRPDLAWLPIFYTDLSADAIGSDLSDGFGLTLPAFGYLGDAHIHTADDEAYATESLNISSQTIKLEFLIQKSIVTSVSAFDAAVTSGQTAPASRLIAGLMDSCSRALAQRILGLAAQSPMSYGSSATDLATDDFPFINKEFRKRHVNTSGKVMLINSTTEANLAKELSSTLGEGNRALREGATGRLGGFDIIPTEFLDDLGFVSGKLSETVGGAAVSVFVDADTAAGAKELTFAPASGNLVGSLPAGELFKVVDGEQYAVAEAASCSANKITVKLTTPLAKAVTAGDAIVFTLTPGATTDFNIAYVPNTFAVVTRPISDTKSIAGTSLGNGAYALVTDPITGITYRLFVEALNNGRSVQWNLDCRVGLKNLLAVGSARNFVKA